MFTSPALLLPADKKGRSSRCFSGLRLLGNGGWLSLVVVSS